MERYKILGELGDGTCGCVYKALNMETLEIVAVKKMKRKFYYWEECMNLREVKALRRLDHPNVVKLKEVVRENNELFFVFEYMEHNLYQIIRERHGKPFSEEEIRHYISQVLQGLDHMHKNGYFHRDLKPENLLVTDNALKIADLGLAREVSSAPPYTEYVSTRWYRAPEVLLQSSAYTPAIDMWAVGAIVAELFTLSPIFPGDSEFDQLYKICRVLGFPEWYSLPGGTNFSRLMNISFSEIFPTDLSAIIPNASPEAIDLIKQLCSWNPMKRPTAEEALKHPFFHAWKWGPINSDESKLDRIGAIPNLELNLWDFGNQTDDCFLGLTLAVNPSNKSLDVIHSVSRGLADDILFGSAYEDGAEPSGEVLDLLELLHGCFTSLTQCRKMLARHFLVTFVYGLFIGRYFHLTKVNTLRRLILHCHSPSAAQLGIIPPLESHCRPGCPSLLCSPICWTALCWPLALLFDIGFKEVSCLLSHIPVNKGRTLH